MKFASTFVVLYTIWILLVTWTLQEFIVGAVVSVVLSFLISKYVTYKLDFLLPLRLLNFVLHYLPVFIFELIKANLDIAARVLRVEIPLNPGIVEVKTDIKSEYGKLTLANSITLTPGTLSLEQKEDKVYVHCVDVVGDTKEEQAKNIAGKFEHILGGIFK
jgi:multicomponent Na+:H+ antiporter subunit E